MFERGDIVHLQFDPSTGREMKGPHYGLVVSRREVNNMGGGLVCPITGGRQDVARSLGLAASLSGAGLMTDGVVLTVQVRFCDFRARRARFVERVPDYILDDVIAKLAAIIGADE